MSNHDPRSSVSRAGFCLLIATVLLVSLVALLPRHLFAAETDTTADSLIKVVRGRVETNTGVAVAQAEIVAVNEGRPERQTTLTDATGEYELLLAEGLWALTVRPIEATDPADRRHLADRSLHRL